MLSNRTDLLDQPRTTAAHVQQAASDAATPVAPAAPAAVPQPMPRVGPDVPSMFPDRPLTHGMPTGPGAGPEVLGLPSAPRPSDALRSWLMNNPNDDDVRGLIEMLESEGR